MLPDILKTILTVLGSILAAFISYELIEVRRKRKIETYWKIETEYKSEGQQTARKSIEEVGQVFKQHQQLITGHSPQQVHDQLIGYYNTEFHNSPDAAKKEMAWKIRTRIRFLHLTGVLLRKNMIDKDLLFSLIGLGFEIDYPVLSIILEAHRKDHHTPALYNHVEYLWNEYLTWKNRLPVTVT